MSFGQFFLRRFFDSIVTLWVILTVTFVLLRFLPGGPFDEEQELPEFVRNQLEASYQIDQPLAIQYISYVKKVLRGDFGESIAALGEPVYKIIQDHLPTSMLLGGLALVLAFLIGLPIGLTAAYSNNSGRGLWDRCVMFFSTCAVALPSFLAASLLVMIFSFYLDLLPPALWLGPKYYVLPVLALSLRPTALVARLIRSNALEVMATDFIRTAYAKGLSSVAVLLRHVLRNSFLPVLTISGPLVAGILTGSFVIELIFAIPGIGKYFVESVVNRDYPMILGMTLLYSVFLVTANLIVDLLYGVFDPRVRAG